MAFLSFEEFRELGFEANESEFDKLEQLARRSVALYVSRNYDLINFEHEVEPRKAAIKMAIAYQIDYLNRSGVLTAEDRQMLSSVTIGRTSIGYHSSVLSGSSAKQYNLSLDAENWLKSVGFGYSGVSYAR